MHPEKKSSGGNSCPPHGSGTKDNRGWILINSIKTNKIKYNRLAGTMVAKIVFTSAPVRFSQQRAQTAG
jgi:hypothetical protein